ncbi:MAG: hypothetical protein ACR652_18465 [Methylocystis sp.]|uniref:hypothetical protein n=1 Tax=Methylocystis sp. TaxID=1911079 RepID=UPI003DA5D588
MSSVLETFLILFESNADDVDKGTQKAEKSSKSLEEALRQVDGQTDKVGDGFLKMASSLGGAIGAALSVAGITAAVMSAADNADALGEFSDKLGLNIEEVNAWGDAVQVNGGTAEGFRGSLESLIDGMVTFATKGTSRVSPFFDELGIKMVDAEGKARDVMEVLPELADAFEGLSKQESAGLGRKLGLDQGTIMLLQQGRRAVDEQIAKQKELGTVTKEAAEIAGKFNDEYDNTAKVFRSLFTIVGSSVLPALTAILGGVQRFGGFLAKNSDFVVGLLIALGSAVLIYALPPFVSLAVAVVTAFAPFLLMGAVIAGVSIAFALLYDDIMNFIDGNDSLIGQILTQFPMIGDVIQGVIGYVKALWDAVSWVFESIVSVLQISIEGWRVLFGVIADGFSGFVSGSSVVQTMLATLAENFQSFKDIVGGVWDGLTSKVQGFINLIRNVITLISGVAGKITGVLDGVKANLGIGEAQAAIAESGSTAINNTSSNAISNSSKSVNKTTSVQTGPITVQTQATDAEGIAGAIGSSMGQQMRQAASTIDDGVAA